MNTCKGCKHRISGKILHGSTCDACMCRMLHSHCEDHPLYERSVISSFMETFNRLESDRKYLNRRIKK